MSTPSARSTLSMPGLERHDDSLVFFDLVVDVALERADDRGEAVVQLGGVADAAGDDQRRARLVDQDRVDLVDDAVAVAALNLGVEPGRHVVAQVVEAQLVVGAVGDVGGVVATLLLGPVFEAGDDQSDVEPHALVDAAHPLGVAAGQVVVDGDEVDALAAERVEVGRERGDEGLALAGLHLGDPAEVERRATHQLDVEVALADHPSAASRMTANDSTRMSSRVAPLSSRWRNSTVLPAARRRTTPASRRSRALMSGTIACRAFTSCPLRRGGCDRECSCGRKAYRWVIGRSVAPLAPLRSVALSSSHTLLVGLAYWLPLLGGEAAGRIQRPSH